MAHLTLTPTQQTALELMSHGHTARQAARYVGVSEHTMREHWKTVRLKLGVRRNHHAVAVAYQKGLLP